MVDSKDEHFVDPKLSQEIKKMSGSIPKELVTLFFSFDTVNSTYYKTMALGNSINIIKAVFDEIERLMRDHINGIQYWRTVGDEIIFFLEIFKMEEIFEAVEYMFSILHQVRIEILDDKLKMSDDVGEKETRHSSLISIKGTCWLALVGDTNKSLNRKFKNGMLTNDKRLEFQGHDIDVGFRVSKFTRNRRLAVNFELAYLLSNYDAYKDKLKFISYQTLKGIWNGRKYPIIWYHSKVLKPLNGSNKSDPDENIIDDFESSFFYDEGDFCEMTQNLIDIKDSSKGNFLIEIKKDIGELLKQICNDLNLTKKLNTITDEIKNRNEQERDRVEGVRKELQFVIICQISTKEILLFRRKRDQKIDFGCIKFDMNQDSFFNIVGGIDKTIISKYQEKYGVSPKIKSTLKTFSINNGEKKVGGLIYKGAITKKQEKELTAPNKREYKGLIVNEKNYADYKDDYANPDEFIKIIKKVLIIK